MVLTIVPKPEAVDEAVVEHSRHRPQLSARTDVHLRGRDEFDGTQAVGAKTWGYTYHDFRDFGGPRGWLAGLEGG